MTNVAVIFTARQVDCCNGILYSVSALIIRWLLTFLNTAACPVVGASNIQHIITVLCDVLHWLLAHQSILFKVAVTALTVSMALAQPTSNTCVCQSLTPLVSETS